jgi:hypothetical protein
MTTKVTKPKKYLNMVVGFGIMAPTPKSTTSMQLSNMISLNKI